MSVKMYGYALDKSGTVVNREVPELDVAAYEAAGYKKGTRDGAPTAEEYGASKPRAEVAPDGDLDSMTKAQLLDLAESQGVDVAKSANKADIIAAIEGE